MANQAQDTSRTPTAPYLQVQGVTKTFGRFAAVDDVSLDVTRGEFVCILGPSGCGKTTLLRIIAGLEEHETGRIIQEGVDVSGLPPSRRDFGIVFQSYALFPNLSAADNVSYGLRNIRLPESQVLANVRRLLELVGLIDLGNRYPAQLSGGQQQRVALARALALSPGLLLLDEPLSALDARVRAALRAEVVALQRRLGVTTVMVTHDQEEALTMADRIVVMRDGKIVQVGTPLEIYQEPATSFVADFVGVMNFLPGVMAPDRRHVVYGDCALAIAPQDGPPDAGSAVNLAIRPEEVIVVNGTAPETNVLQTEIEDVEFIGPFYRLKLRLSVCGAAQQELSLVAYISPKAGVSVSRGGTLPIHLPTDRMRVYPANGRSPVGAVHTR